MHATHTQICHNIPQKIFDHKLIFATNILDHYLLTQQFVTLLQICLTLTDYTLTHLLCVHSPICLTFTDHTLTSKLTHI